MKKSERVPWTTSLPTLVLFRMFSAFPASDKDPQWTKLHGDSANLHDYQDTCRERGPGWPELQKWSTCGTSNSSAVQDDSTIGITARSCPLGGLCTLLGTITVSGRFHIPILETRSHELLSHQSNMGVKAN